MKKLSSIVLILSLFACSATYQEQIDSILANYTGDVPGASLLVIKNGVKLFEKTSGLGSLEDKTPVNPQSNFRLASVTKQFTAMCLLILEKEGKVIFTESLTDIFPDFPDYGKNITVKQLLNHTSGLVAYEDLLPDTMTSQVLDKDVLELMKSVDSTYHSPGTKYHYSNSGYAVLAMIIEQKSGIPFAQYLKQNIFEPLDMTNSLAYEKGISQLPFRAYGYAETNSGFIFKDQSRTSAVLGDGGIYSSINDLLKWDQALYTEKLVPFESLNRAWTPAIVSETPDNTYGYGWRIDEYKGHRRIHHNGSTSGFRNTIQRFPDDSLTIILLTNRAEPDVFPIAERISSVFLD